MLPAATSSVSELLVHLRASPSACPHLPASVYEGSGRGPRLWPCLLNTNQGILCQDYKEGAGIFLISKEDSWRTDAFQSFPTLPPSSERKCQSIKGGLIWINTAPNTHSPSASVKGSHGFLDFTPVNAFPSKFKCYKEVIYIYLGSW